MGYDRKLLTDDETIVREFRPHWKLLFIPLIWLIVGALAIAAGFGVTDSDDGTLRLIVTGAVVLLWVWLVVSPIVKWWFTLYVLTTERLIQRSGVIARQGVEIPLENITNVLFEQNVFERLLGFGDLLIESAGESGQSRFSDIPDPEEFQHLLYRTRESRTTAIGNAPATDATAKLQRLAELHRDGVLSDEEFDEKKRTLLDEI